MLCLLSLCHTSLLTSSIVPGYVDILQVAGHNVAAAGGGGQTPCGGGGMAVGHREAPLCRRRQPESPLARQDNSSSCCSRHSGPQFLFLADGGRERERVREREREPTVVGDSHNFTRIYINIT